ncbi:hypothetical protein CF640_36810 [Burkholderia pseudomallei]|nr:hypothetical protein CF640_36810 [Burkholderia pseudomallei]
MARNQGNPRTRLDRIGPIPGVAPQWCNFRRACRRARGCASARPAAGAAEVAPLRRDARNRADSVEPRARISLIPRQPALRPPDGPAPQACEAPPALVLRARRPSVLA